jgi:O-antigen ligase
VKREIHQKISTGALLLTVASMPFSVFVCHWSFIVFMVCWLLEGQWSQRLELLADRWIAILLPLFFMVHVMGMLYTGNVSSGWVQLEKKAAFLLVPLTLATTTRLTEGISRQLMKVFVMSCLAATLICLGNATWLTISESPQQNFNLFSMDEFLRLNPGASPTWMNFSYQGLSSGIGLHPTYFGLYLCVCLLIVLFLAQGDVLSQVERRVALAIFVYFTVFIFLLSSRIAIIAAVAISLSALVAVSRQGARTTMFVRQAAVVGLFALIIYANPVSRFRGLQEPAGASRDNLTYAISSIDIRLSLLKVSQLAADNVNFWTGAGTGAGVDLLRAEGTEHGIANVLDTYDPHNQFIYTFFELGFPGLTALIALFFVPLYYGWRRRSYLIAGCMLVIAIGCLTESVLEVQKGIILFSFFGSLFLLSPSNPIAENARPRAKGTT